MAAADHESSSGGSERDDHEGEKAKAGVDGESGEFGDAFSFFGCSGEGEACGTRSGEGEGRREDEGEGEREERVSDADADADSDPGCGSESRKGEKREGGRCDVGVVCVFRVFRILVAESLNEVNPEDDAVDVADGFYGVFTESELAFSLRIKLKLKLGERN